MFVHAVPIQLRIRAREVNRDRITAPHFQIGDNFFNPTLSNSRDFYALLMSNKARESKGFTKLKSKFSIDDIEARKAFLSIRSCICETFAQCFQSKILNDITFTLPFQLRWV